MIAANIIAEVTDDGADMAPPMYGSGFEWDEDSYCRCPECDFEGELKDFRKLPPDPERKSDKRAEGAAAALASLLNHAERNARLMQHAADLLRELGYDDIGLDLFTSGQDLRQAIAEATGRPA